MKFCYRIFTSKINIIMKSKFYLILPALICLSCSDTIDETVNEQNKKALSPYHISESQAFDVAESFWARKHKSRSLSTSPEVEYVIKNSTLSRSYNELSDTLAYIFTYPENQGFTIVASDNRVNPILAYSEYGQFSFTNEAVVENFIDNIGDYMLDKIADGHSDTPDNMESCVVISPYIQESIDQKYPYNKYVAKEHPNCPAGCVAVATANIMIQSLNSMTYHNSHFEFAAIRDAYAEANDPSIPKNAKRRVVGGPIPKYPAANTSIKYTYEEAIDSVAKMLYWIGKDLDMSYSPGSSSAFSSDALNLLKQLSLDVKHSSLVTYNIKAICSYINNDYIAYMRGRDGSVGHAWVCDGCSFCVAGDRTFNEYIHCDWGWGGISNGFYNGDVFAASSYNFTGMTYFAVKRHLSGSALYN